MRTVLMADGVAPDDPRWRLERRDERGDGLPRGLRDLGKAVRPVRHAVYQSICTVFS